MEWVALAFSRGSLQPRDQAHVSMSPPLADGVLTTSAAWEALIMSEEKIKNVQCWE